ncbi:DinB family protein [Chitinophaga sp. 212800010-3]|uniref:DinB family protein n=1 Tax=unclassified Chitinophaga TaxID=2619133 RepID=UPI002DF111CB|nr:DinB-2 domain-containing protein [Chitinophaga sp. 212800010-3]
MKKQLLATLENARNYTLNVAGAMPADKYHFKPAPESWSFNELMHHIGYGIIWWKENYVQQTATPWDPPAVTKSASATRKYLSDNFDMLQESIGEITLDEKAVNGFHATIDHITHHRGQATVYLRCCGITPPEYGY